MKKLRLLGLTLLICLVFTAFVACGEDVSVTGVSLDKTTASIEVSKTVQLTATVTPSDATDKSVTWSSDKTDIATVSSSGLVTGKAVGTAVITVKTTDGEKTATCTVTVTAAAPAEKTATQVKTALEAAGYTVEVSTILNVSVLEADKDADILMVIFYPSEALATAGKSTYDAMAELWEVTCKQNGKILYFGTAAAVTAYEAI